MHHTDQSATPIQSINRIHSLDVLRGFAILGILIVNIQFFSMIGTAYYNPSSYEDLTGINFLVWLLSHVMGDQKFMTIFSLLYGAGIFIFCNRAEDKGRNPRKLHYQRTRWLLIFGLLHAYFLWAGDILVTYALCAMIMYPFRKVSPRTGIIVGVILLIIPFLFNLFFAWTLQFWPEDQMEITIDQSWAPQATTIEHELSVYRGSWSKQNEKRMETALFMQTALFLIWSAWRVCGLMFIGMALFKLQILSAIRSNRFYTWMVIAGLATGIPLILTGVTNNFAANWDYRYSMFWGMNFNYWGSLSIAAAYIGLVMLVVKKNVFPAMISLFASIGRMAFSHYILQSLICVFIFYGSGLGLFGSVQRWQQALIVLAVWAVEVLFTMFWRKHFKYGPLEWLWRSLTYRSLQPLRKQPESIDTKKL